MAGPTQVKLVTVEEFALMDDPLDGSTQELVRGEVVTLPPPFTDHGRWVSRLAIPIAVHVDQNKLGEAFVGECGFVLARDPDTVRSPDYAFVRTESLPAMGGKGWYEQAPELVGEVVSPSNRPAYVMAKAADWLSAGDEVVLVLWPERGVLQVWRSPTDIALLTADGTLALPDLLPGFELPLSRVFRD